MQEGNKVSLTKLEEFSKKAATFKENERDPFFDLDDKNTKQKTCTRKWDDLWLNCKKNKLSDTDDKLQPAKQSTRETKIVAKTWTWLYPPKRKERNEDNGRDGLSNHQLEDGMPTLVATTSAPRECENEIVLGKHLDFEHSILGNDSSVGSKDEPLNGGKPRVELQLEPQGNLDVEFLNFWSIGGEKRNGRPF